MTVLVAYDGSRPAQKAVERAVNQHPDEEIILLGVIEAAGGSLGAGFDLIKERLKEGRDEVAEEISEDLKDVLHRDDIDVRMETAVGQPAREVVSFAEEHDVDEIIVGSHGREGVSRVLLGSVAEKIARRAPITVTIVR
jgi:nucleotide-binding universal stress UspA family protein